MIGIKLKQLKGTYMYDYNKKRHQYGGSECGVYSMNFIIESLKGKTIADIQKEKITDNHVNLLRNYLYRPPKNIENLVGGNKKTKRKK